MRQLTVKDVISDLLGMEQLTKQEKDVLDRAVVTVLTDEELQEPIIRELTDIYSKYTLVDPNERVDYMIVEPLDTTLDLYQLSEKVTGLIIWIAFYSDTRPVVTMPTNEVAAAIMVERKHDTAGVLYHAKVTDGDDHTLFVDYAYMIEFLTPILPPDVMEGIVSKYDSAIKTALEMRNSVH